MIQLELPLTGKVITLDVSRHQDILSALRGPDSGSKLLKSYGTEVVRGMIKGWTYGFYRALPSPSNFEDTAKDGFKTKAVSIMESPSSKHYAHHLSRAFFAIRRECDDKFRLGVCEYLLIDSFHKLWVALLSYESDFNLVSEHLRDICLANVAAVEDVEG